MGEIILTPIETEQDSFVTEYGLVQYSTWNLKGRYPRANYCDIKSCEEVRLIPGVFGDRSRYSRTYVYDHCHEHGWIRGYVCQSCNMKLRNIDAGMPPVDYYYGIKIWSGFSPPENAVKHPKYDGLYLGIPGTAYAEYRSICPEC